MTADGNRHLRLHAHTGEERGLESPAAAREAQARIEPAAVITMSLCPGGICERTKACAALLMDSSG